MFDQALKRRTFLKAAAIVGLAAAAGSAAGGGLVPLAEAHADGGVSETKVIRTACRNCTGRCGVLAHVQNGRVVKIEGDPKHYFSQGKLCAKGLSQLQALYNPNRIKYPMRRVGARGENKWERISWDEAMGEIADHLIEMEAKYGAECLVVGTGGGGHPYFGAGFNPFCNVFGAPNITEAGGLQCLIPRSWTQSLMGVNVTDYTSNGGTNLKSRDLAENTKCFVLWGSNPGNSNIGCAERPTAELRAAGAKSIVVDPRFTPDASKADIWLPVRPGSDVALMLCWIGYMIDNDLYDKEAVLRWTNLPFLINPETKLAMTAAEAGLEGDELTYVVWDRKTNSPQPLPYHPFNEELDIALEGGPYLVNGVECTPAFQLLHERTAEHTIERTAELCWLEADKIEEAVRLFAENTPGFLCSGMCSDHSVNSAQAGMSLLIIDILAGNFGKPGTFIQQFSSGIGYTSYMGTFAHFMPYEQYVKKIGAVEYKPVYSCDYVHNWQLVNAMLTGEPYQPRIWIEESGNKMINYPNVERFVEALEKMEFIVHHFQYPTSFTKYADIVLPGTEWLEYNWVGAADNHFTVHQEATHLWEDMEEPMFWHHLALKMAEKGHKRFQDSCDPEKFMPNEDNIPEGFIGDTSGANLIPWQRTMEDMYDALWGKLGLEMTWKQMCDHMNKEGNFQVKSDEEYKEYEKYKQIDPETGIPNGWPTPSKKIELYAQQVTTCGRTGVPSTIYVVPPAPEDYDPLPYYREPPESPLDPELAAEYPLVFTGGHIRQYTHCTLRNIPWLRERFPVPDLSMNPVDAEKYGVGDGDWVWIETKRGRTQGRARVCLEVAPGVVHMERFWFPENIYAESGGFKEMGVNMLTKDDGPFSDIIGSTVYRGFQVKVYKADSAPAVWTEPEQFSEWLPAYDDAVVTDVAEIAGGKQID